jgi:hypothetical protein
MAKKCELYDRECISCGECDICDLDSSKKCNNCGKCLDDFFEDYKSVNIDQFIRIAEEKELIRKGKKLSKAE